MPIELIEDSLPANGTEKPPREWIIVSDTTSEVVKSSENKDEILTLAKLVRRAGGVVTVFKSTEY